MMPVCAQQAENRIPPMSQFDGGWIGKVEDDVGEGGQEIRQGNGQGGGWAA